MPEQLGAWHCPAKLSSFRWRSASSAWKAVTLATAVRGALGWWALPLTSLANSGGSLDASLRNTSRQQPRPPLLGMGGG